MKLLTKEILKKLPRIYETEKIKLEDKIIYVHLFNPFSNWDWYICEFDPEDNLAFGFINGHSQEWGYIPMHDIEALKVCGLPVERDMYFKPKKFSEIKIQGEKKWA